jgi:hypothetical protein
MSQTNDSSGRWRKVVSCLVGGVAAGFAAPLICAAGGGMAVAAVGAAIIGSTVTTVSDNAMKPTIQEVRYHPQAAQRMFRSAVSQFLSIHFNPIIESIRRNRTASFGPLSFSVNVNEVHGVIGFAYSDGTSIFIEFAFRVRPRPGTPERDLDESRPPPDLPDYTNPDDTVPYALPDDLRNANQSLFDGLGWAIVRGAAIGTVGGLFLPLAPGWYFLETAPGVAGIVYGIPTATGSVSSVVEFVNDDPTPYERIAYSIHFASEIGLNVNRVIECANQNGVELEYHIKAGIGRRAFVAGLGNGGNALQGTDWVQVWYENRSHLLP